MELRIQFSNLIPIKDDAQSFNAKITIESETGYEFHVYQNGFRFKNGKIFPPSFPYGRGKYFDAALYSENFVEFFTQAFEKKFNLVVSKSYLSPNEDKLEKLFGKEYLEEEKLKVKKQETKEDLDEEIMEEIKEYIFQADEWV